jgi:hypothetical protein
MTEQNSEKPAKAFRRIGLFGGISVLIAIALTAAGLAWHQQPDFCGICHTPMTSYVQGYNGGDDMLMITPHAKGKKAVRCLDCHKQTLKQEITEAVYWFTGNYDYPLTKREFGTREFCLTSGCHDEGEILEATRENKMSRAINSIGDAVEYNQHDPRHGKQACFRCHSVHGKSVLLCNQCHKLKEPKGWTSPAPNGVVAAQEIFAPANPMGDPPAPPVRQAPFDKY